MEGILTRNITFWKDKCFSKVFYNTETFVQNIYIPTPVNMTPGLPYSRITARMIFRYKTYRAQILLTIHSIQNIQKINSKSPILFRSLRSSWLLLHACFRCEQTLVTVSMGETRLTPAPAPGWGPHRGLASHNTDTCEQAEAEARPQRCNGQCMYNILHKLHHQTF